MKFFFNHRGISEKHFGHFIDTWAVYLIHWTILLKMLFTTTMHVHSRNLKIRKSWLYAVKAHLESYSVDALIKWNSLQHWKEIMQHCQIWIWWLLFSQPLSLVSNHCEIHHNHSLQQQWFDKTEAVRSENELGC